MGAGFVYKRRLENLKSLFRFRRRKNRKPVHEEKTAVDSMAVIKNDSTDTIPVNAE